MDWRNINFIFSLKWDFVSKWLTHDVGDKIETFFSSFLVLKGYEIMFLMLYRENMPLHITRWSVLYSRKNGIFAKWLTYLRYLPRVRSGWQDFGHVFFLAFLWTETKQQHAREWANGRNMLHPTMSCPSARGLITRPLLLL